METHVAKVKVMTRWRVVSCRGSDDGDMMAGCVCVIDRKTDGFSLHQQNHKWSTNTVVSAYTNGPRETEKPIL